MVVLLPNTALAVRRAAAPTYDAHGVPVRGAYGQATAAYPGLTRERDDGGWTLSLHPELWPLRKDDVVVEPGTGREWTVVAAILCKNDFDGYVNYVRTDARERKTGGTEPGGAEFTAR